MELGAHEVRVVLDLEDLHTLAGLVLSDKVETSSLELVDILGVDLVTVTVSLLNLLVATVEGTDLGPLTVGLEDSLPGSETHGTAHVVFVELGHGDDHAVAGSGVKLFGVGLWHVADIAGELDSSGLETKTDLGIRLAHDWFQESYLHIDLLPEKASNSLEQTWTPTSYPQYHACQTHRAQ